MYYLWPTQKSYASEKPAYCEERSFFNLMERVEAMGIPSRYPAPAQLYRQLCGKLLYTGLCLHKEYKIPPNVRIYASEWLDDEDEVIDNALYALNELRRDLWGKGPCTSGVVKLGFSWMGQDVVKFTSRDDFRDKLRVIFGSLHQIPTSCFVQEFVENRIVELRIHAFADSERGFHYELVYILLINTEEVEEVDVISLEAQDEASTMSVGTTSQATPRLATNGGGKEGIIRMEDGNPGMHQGGDDKHDDLPNGNSDGIQMEDGNPGVPRNGKQAPVDTIKEANPFMTTGVEIVTPEAATEQIWKGNVKAQKIAEAEARNLADRWLTWYRCEWNSKRCPANARFDFHVCWDGVANPEVWTCEVTECGAWLCGINIERRNVAMINSMFTDKKCAEKVCVCKNMLPLPPP